MDFEEMKKVWDSQNQQVMYVINEEALHKRIRSKKKRSQRLANTTEYVFIVSTILAGSIILVKNIWVADHSIFKYSAAAFFYLITVYLFYRRSLRKNEVQNFEQTMMGDLEHAFLNASYQVKLSSTMMNVVFPAISLLAILTEWISSGFSWMVPAVILFFSVTYYAARWEHRYYESKLKELRSLKTKLLEEPEV